MSREVSSTRIGIFVIGIIVLLIAVITLFGSRAAFGPRDHYVMYFRGSVAGLYPGASVKLLGVPIGSVTTISAILDENAEFFVEVRTKVTPEVVRNVGGLFQGEDARTVLTQLVGRGMRAQLATESLVLGRLYIKFDYFPDTPVELVGLAEDSRLLEVPVVPQAGEQLQRTITRIADALEEFPFEEVSASIVSTVTGLDSLVHSVDFAATVAEVNQTLDQLQQVLNGINDSVGPISESIQTTTDATSAIVAKVDSLMTSWERAVSEDRVRVHTTLRDFALAARAVRTLADYLERNPGSIVWGKD